MIGLSESDKKHIDRQTRRDEKQRSVLNTAKARGKAAAKWLSKNKLTPETKSEFDSLMKQVNSSR